MKLRCITVLFLLSLLTGAFGITVDSQLSRVEAVIEAWSSRSETRSAILSVTPHPVHILVDIAKSKREPDVRRIHAIALLGTFNDSSSIRALDQLTNDKDPKYRCLALESLAEAASGNAISVLITKLDDQEVCMKDVATDPAVEREVFVSDEAVRLLEQVTGYSFEPKYDRGHRATQPWEKWWSKRKVSKPNS
jgi:HEAT repeats